MLCYTILYYTLLYHTILYYTILYSTILYYTGKPSSSSNFSIRVFRAYPLIETRQTVPRRAIREIRGASTSVGSTLTPS